MAAARGAQRGRWHLVYSARGKNAANQAAEQIAFRLRRGDSVAVFPEGTTTNGTGVRRFHPRLFGAATHSETYVQPVAIRYPHTLGVHPATPFMNSEPLFSHGLRVLAERRIDVELTLCRPLASHAIDRRKLSEQAHAAIRQIVESRPDLPRTQAMPDAR